MPQIFLLGICLILSQVSLPVEIFHVIRQFTVELNCSYSHKGFPNPLLSPCCHLHPALLIVSTMDRERKVLPFPLQLLFKHLKNIFVFHFSLLPILLTKPLQCSSTVSRHVGHICYIFFVLSFGLVSWLASFLNCNAQAWMQHFC